MLVLGERRETRAPMRIFISSNLVHRSWTPRWQRFKQSSQSNGCKCYTYKLEALLYPVRRKTRERCVVAFDASPPAVLRQWG